MVKGLAIGIVLMIGVFFAYRGWQMPVWEGDSKAYHLPIARIVAEGMIWNKTAYTNLFYWYPATGESILAGMMKLGWPVCWFNLVGWILLTWGVFRWGRKKGLKSEEAWVVVLIVGTWTSVTRLLLTQTVDIWLAVVWVWLICELEREKLKWWAVGLLMGGVVGMKYSGLAYLAVLIGVYGRKMWRQMNWKYFAIGIGCFVGGGGIWYVRNWLLTGNPIYPGGFLWWQVAEGFYLQNWQPIRTLLKYPGGWKIWTGAMVSEYTVWAAVPLVALVKRNREVLIGLANGAIYMLLPSWPVNVVSDLRYLFVAMIPLTMAVAMWVKEKKLTEVWAMVAVLGSVSVMPQLDYLPKLFTMVVLGWGVWVWKRKV